jgi:hypothetical protein
LQPQGQRLTLAKVLEEQRAAGPRRHNGRNGEGSNGQGSPSSRPGWRGRSIRHQAQVVFEQIAPGAAGEAAGQRSRGAGARFVKRQHHGHRQRAGNRGGQQHGDPKGEQGHGLSFVPP